MPFIVLSPLPGVVANGTEFTLDCVAEGSPPPVVQWLLNREPVNLTDGGNFQQLDNDSLVVAEAGEATAGFFTCVADNEFGHSEVTVFLVVTEEDLAENTTGVYRCM